MPKRTPNDKDEDETIVHAQALKLLRTNTHSVSTEDDIDDEQCDDNDCIILATCPGIYLLYFVSLVRLLFPLTCIHSLAVCCAIVRCLHVDGLAAIRPQYQYHMP